MQAMRHKVFGCERASNPFVKKGQGRLIHVSDFINEEDG